MSRNPGLLLMLLIFGAATPADAASLLVPASTAMAVGAAMPMPAGHRDFCAAHPEDCGPMDDRGPEAMSPARWRAVWQVNRGVNARIAGRTDREIFDREEVWTYPDTQGDCEDYVLLKRRLLVAAGFADSNLLITTVRLEDGSGHAVLTLRTADGDYVLDNLENRVRPWRETGYEFVRRQASDHARRWLSIENGGGRPSPPRSVSKPN